MKRMNSARVVFGSAAWVSMVLVFLCPVDALCAEVRPPPDVQHVQSSLCAASAAAVAPKYSAHEISLLYERPSDVAGLLRNLKVAFDRDLLLQPEFYDDANLLKFFAGSRVKHDQPNPQLARGATEQSFEVVSGSGALTRMSIRLKRSCASVAAYDTPAGHFPPHARLGAGATLEVAGVQGFTLGPVRAVLGRETTAWFDHGIATDGATYVPTSKGRVIYEVRDRIDAARSKIEISSVTFLVKPDPPIGPDERPPQAERFTDSDGVQRIEILIRER
jgi:hypothetical protein